MLCTRAVIAMPMFCRAGNRNARRFDLRAPRPYRRKPKFPRAYGDRGSAYTRDVLCCPRLHFKPQEKAKRLVEAAEASERENIDHLQALDRACVQVLDSSPVSSRAPLLTRPWALVI
jgi:hypothetical protein